MSKVLVLYYSSYGHIEAMANAAAEGARQTGAHVDVKDPGRDYRRLTKWCDDDRRCDGSRLPTANELEAARYQGRKTAEVANKLHVTSATLAAVDA